MVLLVPYLWLALFFLVPFLIVLKNQPVAARNRAAAHTPVLISPGGLDGLRAFIGGTGRAR